MSKTLRTELKDLNLSKNISLMWDKVLIPDFEKKNDISFWRNEKIVFNNMIMNGFRVFEFFIQINEHYKLEISNRRVQEFVNEKKEEETRKVLTLDFLGLLRKEGVDLYEILLNNIKTDENNNGGWEYSKFKEILIADLKNQNKYLDVNLKNIFLKEIEEQKKYSSYKSIDEEINIYLNLLEVINPKELSYDWFKHNLEMFCMLENHNQEVVSHKDFLNFDSQRKIQKYIKENYPSKIDENKDFFRDLIDIENYSSEYFYQATISINIYKLLWEKKLNQEDAGHLKSIVRECMKTINKSAYKNLLGRYFEICNIEVKEEGNSKLKIYMSSKDEEDLVFFEDVAKKSLKGVLKISEKIYIHMLDSFFEEEEVNTNMNEELIFKQYLSEKLKEELSENSSFKKKYKI